MRLDRRSDPRARAVQQHPLIAVADAERLGHLVGREAFDIAHRYHRALRGRQLVDRPQDCVTRLALEQLLLRCLPIARPEHPGASPAVAGVEESVWIDRPLVIARPRPATGPGRTPVAP